MKLAVERATYRVKVTAHPAFHSFLHSLITSPVLLYRPSLVIAKDILKYLNRFRRIMPLASRRLLKQDRNASGQPSCKHALFGRPHRTNVSRPRLLGVARGFPTIEMRFGTES